MADEKRTQEKYVEYQVLQQTIAQLYQKKGVVQKQIVEFTDLRDNLSNLQKSKIGSQMYSAVGAGVFVKAELKENDNVLVNVGSDVVIERSVDDSKKLVDNQIKELNGILKELDKNIEGSIERGNILNKELSETQAKEHKH